MIWHFAEVWLLLAVMFAVGSVLGAYLYFVLAESRFAIAQGEVADRVGDLLDRAKVRFGLAPIWRRGHLAGVERPLPAAPAVAEAALPMAEITAVRVLQLEPPAAPAAGVAPVGADMEPLAEPEPEAVEERPAPSALKTLIEAARPRLLAARRVATTEQQVELFNEDAGGGEYQDEAAVALGPDGVAPKRPAGLSGPRGGVADNLTRIRGVGRRNEQLLNSLGIYHFGQIAAWTPAEMAWIGQYLAFPERIERDNWIGQAIVLASGAETGFEKAADRRRRKRQDKMMAEQQLRRAELALFGGEVTPAQPPEPPEPARPPVGAPLAEEEENELSAALQSALEKAAAAGRAAERRAEKAAQADEPKPVAEKEKS